MSASQTELYNLALSASGTRAKVSSPTEVSKEAQTCNLWYPIVRKTVLMAAPWASAKKTANLTLLATRDFDAVWAEGDPQPNWAYTHAAPSDFIYPRFFDDFTSFELGDEDGQAVFYSNQETPVLVYTKDQAVPPAWDVSLYLAMANMLGAQIAMNLHGKPARAQKVLDTANQMVLTARVNSANTDMVEYDSMPDWLIARGAVVGTVPSRFVYQVGPLLSLIGAF